MRGLEGWVWGGWRLACIPKTGDRCHLKQTQLSSGIDFRVAFVNPLWSKLGPKVKICQTALKQLPALKAHTNSMRHVSVREVFSVIGFMYALGDYLEMASMGSLGGAAYQRLDLAETGYTIL